MTLTAKRTVYILVLLLVAIAAAMLPCAAKADALVFEEATITAEEVNLRLRPDTTSPVVAKLEKGTRIGVFCEEIDGWYRVIYGNYRGYMSTEYVFLPSESIMYGNIILDNTVVRKNPGDYSDSVTTLNSGAGVTVTNIVGNYYCVNYDDESTGYVLSKSVLTREGGSKPSTMYKLGMEGAEVARLQQKLRSRGFLSASATGYYGDKTETAVKLFQKAAGLSADGICGETTLEKLYDDSLEIYMTYAQRMGIKGTVQLSEWDKIKNVIKKGTIFTVTDVKTGKSYKVRRFGGWYHADCEPVSAKDTAIMKEAYGGSWSWDRRAIWVTYNGVTYAASQNGMPHMSNPTPSNNFDGHFCIHFYKSKVHENSKECPRHQSCVQYAYKKGQAS